MNNEGYSITTTTTWSVACRGFKAHKLIFLKLTVFIFSFNQEHVFSNWI